MTSNFTRIGMLMLGVGLVRTGIYAETHEHGSQASEPDWSELNASMDKMKTLRSRVLLAHVLPR